ncbi:hypothetical protein HYE66_02665 [Aggregatibacter actinomycetemcomitans]|nr:hypothetical protein [Aggregatibacter actinomycetemcomitans]
MEFLKVIQDYKDLIPTIITALGSIYGFFKASSSFIQNNAIKRLELFKKYLSKEEIRKLDNESKLIQSLTCSIFPYFRGIPYKDIKKLINVDIEHNFFVFFNLYQKELVDIKARITPKGEKKLNHWKCKVGGLTCLFLIWCSFMIYILAKYFPLPSNIAGWFIMVISVGFPEILLLNFKSIREDLNKFKLNKQTK